MPLASAVAVAPMRLAARRRRRRRTTGRPALGHRRRRAAGKPPNRIAPSPSGNLTRPRRGRRAPPPSAWRASPGGGARGVDEARRSPSGVPLASAPPVIRIEPATGSPWRRRRAPGTCRPAAPPTRRCRRWDRRARRAVDRDGDAEAGRASRRRAVELPPRTGAATPPARASASAPCDDGVGEDVVDGGVGAPRRWRRARRRRRCRGPAPRDGDLGERLAAPPPPAPRFPAARPTPRSAPVDGDSKSRRLPVRDHLPVVSSASTMIGPVMSSGLIDSLKVKWPMVTGTVGT